MKRCPECDSLFNDADQFCELDGTPLVAAVDASDVSVREVATPPQSEPIWTLLPVVTVAGVIIGVLFVSLYFALTRETKQENSNLSAANVTVAQQPLPIRPSQATPAPSADASVEASPSPSVEPSPSPQTSAPRIELSTSPISTAAGTKSGPVIIKLESGVTIEADEAWQTGEGIWYRRSGIVSLLNPKDVKSIEKVPPASPQPTANQTPSP